MNSNLKTTPVLGGKVLIETTCPFCGKAESMTLDEHVWHNGLHAYRSGEHIQNAWPTLTPDQREMVLTGICPKCWDEM